MKKYSMYEKKKQKTILKSDYSDQCAFSHDGNLEFKS